MTIVLIGIAIIAAISGMLLGVESDYDETGGTCPSNHGTHSGYQMKND